ncbi:MAG: protein kinase domain-containing protein [Coleofasciculus sp.]
MRYCLNFNCQNPQNPIDAEICQNCGSELLLDNRYFALKLIGQGGFGRTFLAVDEFLPTKPRCVIKQFFPGASAFNYRERAAELFRSEARQLETLGKHPQIPKRLAYIEQKSSQYLIQEFIDGRNLAEEVSEEGSFDATKIRQLLENLLPVLDFIHAHRIIHRDIKPENIIRRQTDQQLVLVDFGAAKLVAETALTQTGTVIGSARYVAPEQAVGKAVFYSDLYSLGVTCIYLLTQVDPFDLYSFAQDCWVWQDYLHNSVDRELSNILDKMLQRGTFERYQSAAAVLADLKAEPEQVIVSKPTHSPEASVTGLKLSPINWLHIHTIDSESIQFPRTPFPSLFNCSTALSPDGKKLALTGHQHHLVELWDLKTKTLRSKFDVTLARLVISHDNQMLIINGDLDRTSSGATTLIWHLPTGRPIRQLNTKFVSASVDISPDSQILALGGNRGQIELWDVQTGEQTSVLSGHARWFKLLPTISALVYVAITDNTPSLLNRQDSQENRGVPQQSAWLLASASRDKTVRLWDLKTGELLSKLTGHAGWVYSIAVSPDGQTLVSGSADKTVKIWHRETGELVRTLSQFEKPVYSVTISPDGQTLIAGSGDPALTIWNLETGELVNTLEGHPEGVAAVAMSADGETMVSRSLTGQVKIWQPG